MTRSEEQIIYRANCADPLLAVALVKFLRPEAKASAADIVEDVVARVATAGLDAAVNAVAA